MECILSNRSREWERTRKRCRRGWIECRPGGAKEKKISWHSLANGIRNLLSVLYAIFARVFVTGTTDSQSA